MERKTEPRDRDHEPSRRLDGKHDSMVDYCMPICQWVVEFDWRISDLQEENDNESTLSLAIHEPTTITTIIQFHSTSGCRSHGWPRQLKTKKSVSDNYLQPSMPQIEGIHSMNSDDSRRRGWSDALEQEPVYCPACGSQLKAVGLTDDERARIRKTLFGLAGLQVKKHSRNKWEWITNLSVNLLVNRFKHANWKPQYWSSLV